MIRYIEKRDAEECIKMMEEFYSTDAVSHEIPKQNIYNSVEAALDDNPHIRMIVCETEGEYEGFSILSFYYSTEMGGIAVIVEDIYIRDEFKGKGYGTAIFEFIRKEYDGKTNRYKLEVRSDNEAAIRLYKRWGFRESPYKQMGLDLG